MPSYRLLTRSIGTAGTQPHADDRHAGNREDHAGHDPHDSGKCEVDHRIPLFRVWNEYRGAPWPKVLDFWGLPNLQVINRDAHAIKSALEARDRSAARSLENELI